MSVLVKSRLKYENQQQQKHTVGDTTIDRNGRKLIEVGETFQLTVLNRTAMLMDKLSLY